MHYNTLHITLQHSKFIKYKLFPNLIIKLTLILLYLCIDTIIDIALNSIKLYKKELYDEKAVAVISEWKKIPKN